MAHHHAHDTVEEVAFLDVDVELYGKIDRAALLPALGDDVVVLFDGRLERKPVLVFELAGDSAPLDTKLRQLVALIRALPRAARAAWDSAKRRNLDVGIQAGLAPHATSWRLPPGLVADLAAIGAELSITVYGAEVHRAVPSKTRAKPRAARSHR